jgi:hypothetical protein
MEIVAVKKGKQELTMGSRRLLGSLWYKLAKNRRSAEVHQKWEI